MPRTSKLPLYRASDAVQTSRTNEHIDGGEVTFHRWKQENRELANTQNSDVQISSCCSALEHQDLGYPFIRRNISQSTIVTVPAPKPWNYFLLPTFPSHLYNKQQAVQLSFLSPSFFQMTSDTVSLFAAAATAVHVTLSQASRENRPVGLNDTHYSEEREFSRQQQTAPVKLSKMVEQSDRDGI